jgi:uncharacterized protein (TIGR04255 family)
MVKKLNAAPVYYTVAQVQFNHILNLDSYIPSIQAKMRERHFPDFRHEQVQSVILPFIGSPETNQISAPSFASRTRYIFGDIEDSSRFVLETNSVSFQTTNYDTFDSFIDTLIAGLGILHEALSLEFVDRLGVRYLDAVQPTEGVESLGKFLVPEVLGLSQRDPESHQQSVSESIIGTSAGQLVSRVLVRRGQIGLPLELTQLAPKIAPRFMKHSGLHAILDMDASFTQREVFDLTKVKGRLTALHDEIEACFEFVVTEHALATWA